MLLRNRDGRWQDWGNLILGVWLFISPWVLAYVVTGGNPWSAWLSGAIVFFVALWALAMPTLAWTEWVIGIVGIWVFISPWVLHFTSLHRDAWDAWIVGALIFILAAWALARARSMPWAGTPLGPVGNREHTGPLGTWRGFGSSMRPRNPNVPENMPPNTPVTP